MVLCLIDRDGAVFLSLFLGLCLSLCLSLPFVVLGISGIFQLKTCAVPVWDVFMW